MSAPDFLVIGAQKCATSWLHRELRRHPEIFLPDDKDIEFFSYPENLDQETYSAWLRRFDAAGAGQRVGDVNAAYFWTETDSPWDEKESSFNRDIPQSVFKYLGGEAQLIVSIRDPTERAISAYLHHIHHGAVSPEEKLPEIRAPLGIVGMGFYAAHMHNWLNVYPAGQILLIGDLPGTAGLAQRILAGIWEFLGVSPLDAGTNSHEVVFPGIERSIEEDGVWVAADHPSIARHMPLKRDAPMRSRGSRLFVRLVDQSEISRLREIYRSDQQVLSELRESAGFRTVRAGEGIG